MSIYILRHGVDYNVGTVIQRVLDVGTKEGIVYHHHYAMSMRHCCNFANIDESQSRIARALDPYQLGLVRSYKLSNVDFDAGREGDLDAVRSGDFCEIPMGTTIDVRDGDDM